MKTKLLGRLGVWLCNRYSPRPLTDHELAGTKQYVALVCKFMEWYGHEEATKWMYAALWKPQPMSKMEPRSKWQTQ